MEPQPFEITLADGSVVTHFGAEVRVLPDGRLVVLRHEAEFAEGQWTHIQAGISNPLPMPIPPIG